MPSSGQSSSGKLSSELLPVMLLVAAGSSLLGFGIAWAVLNPPSKGKGGEKTSSSSSSSLKKEESVDGSGFSMCRPPPVQRRLMPRSKTDSNVAIDAPPGLTQETLGPLLTDLENQIAGDETSGLPSASPPLTVGVAGGSGSGKTTFARALYEALGEEHVTYLTHDSYYKDLSHLPLAERAKANFDHPNALDTALLVEHVQRLKRGETVQVPEYDFATHCRHPTQTVAAVPRRVILVEGILIFSDPALVKELSIKVFIDTESDLRLIRRIHRDVKERGRSLESIVDQYVKTVRPMHMEFVETSKREADVIIPLGMNQVALDMFLSRLQQEIGDGTLLGESGATTGGDAVSALPSLGGKKKGKESSFIRLGKQGSLSLGKMSS